MVSNTIYFHAMAVVSTGVVPMALVRMEMFPSAVQQVIKQNMKQNQISVSKETKMIK